MKRTTLLLIIFGSIKYLYSLTLQQIKSCRGTRYTIKYLSMKLLHPIFKSCLIILLKIFFRILSISNIIKDPYAKKTMDLYSGEGFTSLFAQIRFWDAPFVELSRFVPHKGRIIDLGCGEGILTNYLAFSRKKGKLLGIDINRERILTASKGLKNCQFRVGNILEERWPPSETIVISNVLHHLPSYADQVLLIKKCVDALPKGGNLIIAEVNKSFSLKYLLGWITDAIIFPMLFERCLFTTNFFHRTNQDWTRVFFNCGFQVQRVVNRKGGPFPDIIIHGTKI